MTDDRFAIEHREAESRFVLVDRAADGGAAEIGEEAYVDVADERVLFRTIVSKEYGGQGLASILVTAVADDIVARGLKLVPVCSYVAVWVRKHPEYADVVVDPRDAHREAAAVREG
ncbi:GNAT family N-acetyltransferase [Microbacterium karelineae]|uniref:GNAT family N-acetyltransferase n=1 Tax=Microbacterium karelineae TaxID=2654283 RepID=UPI0012E99D39|nr:GNAT family N-acetyltransferase [Microbacterium karelineae]